MRFRIYGILTIISALLLVVASIAGASVWWIIAPATVMIASLFLSYRAVAVPLRAVSNGIYLLQSRDFGSRLCKTGEHDADRIVTLFNKLMETMKAERLKNREQYHFLRKLLDKSPMGVAICDFDGNVIESNPAYTSLLQPALEEVLKQLPAGHSRTVRTPGAGVYRCSRLWFMDSGFRRPFLLVEKLTDEIARAEREMFRKIVRTIGHEVNNTMGAIISILDTLGEMHSEETDVASVIGGCRESGQNLVDFVKGYADVVKLPAPVLKETSIVDELRKLMPTLQAIAGEGIEIRLTAGAPETTLQLDMMLMERVIVNLVKNAVESIRNRDNSEPGLICINVNGHELRVTDNGTGIDVKHSSKLFTPFFSTKNSGRGLGLMLVADILRGHNADFSLSTDHETALTTFKIEFPGH